MANAPPRTPTHILIIPDGNRRWARERGLDVLKGHEKGIENIGEVLKWCKEFEIKYVTLWGFSSENRSRSEEEVRGLMQLFESKLFEILDRAEKEKGKEGEYPKVRIKFYGNIAGMPFKIQQYIRQLEERTRNNNEYFVSFLLNYGGAEELAECIRSIAEDYKKGIIHEITYDEIKRRLWTGELPPPDVIIRTSGEYRLSGVMPVQSGYSELFFVKKYWPDFSKEDFVEVLNEYSRRERRFGR
ncbi:MAG: polyprenyl diphosphate synthase [Candidatus Micrarchaeia archaeon]